MMLSVEPAGLLGLFWDKIEQRAAKQGQSGRKGEEERGEREDD